MDYLTNTYYPDCVIDLGFADIVKYGPSSTSKEFAIQRKRQMSTKNYTNQAKKIQ